MTPEGKIDGRSSLARLNETQGGRVDVAERFAARRGAPMPQATATPPAAPDLRVEHVDGFSRADAKAVLMSYENQLIKLEMNMRRGVLLDRSAVRRESVGLGAMLRAGIERVIDQTAPRLAAARNEMQRREIVAKEINRLRTIIKREMPRALRRMRDAGAAKKEGA